MTMHKYGLTMGAALLGALSSGCFNYILGPTVRKGIGSDWTDALAPEIRKGAAAAARNIKAGDAQLLWVGAKESSMRVVRGANDAPVAQEATVVYVVKYPDSDHCVWAQSVLRKEHLGGGSYGPPMLVIRPIGSGSKEPRVFDSNSGAVVCDAVNATGGGVKGPFS